MTMAAGKIPLPYLVNNITKLKRMFENSGYIFSISRTYFVGEKPVCFLNTAEK